MEATQVVQVRLREETIRRAKALAASRGKDLSALIETLVDEVTGEGVTFEAARTAALVDLEAGFDLGGGLRASREELHER
jgi:hypothetical protein